MTYTKYTLEVSQKGCVALMNALQIVFLAEGDHISYSNDENLAWLEIEINTQMAPIFEDWCKARVDIELV